MNPHSVPEIGEVIALFESWEHSFNDLTAAKKFTEAVQLLNDYLEFEPNTPHKAFIETLKLSYTRSLLCHLAQVDTENIETWFQYVLFVSGSKEAETLMATYPELEKDFYAFLEVWEDVLEDYLREARARVRKASNGEDLSSNI